MSNLLLEAKGLAKTYVLGGKPLPVLREASLAVRAGDYLTIRGASGSGKSTLLQVLGGLQRPDAGELRWRGEDVNGWSRARLAEWRGRHVGFVFQSYQLLPEFSALENVEMPALLQGKGDPRKARALLERVGLGGRADHRPAELSGGEQQRVALARALRNGPSLILADEPTGNLDRETGAQIVALLEALPGEGTAVVLVTHDEGIAARGRRRLAVTSGHLEEVT